MIKEREYLPSVDKFKKPIVKTGETSIAILLYRLIVLDPGSDPLHPDMGVGLKRYRYKMDDLAALKKRVEDQIAKFLPCFPAAQVELILTPEKMCNIEVTIDGVIYSYDSSEVTRPIRIDDAADYSGTLRI